LIDNLGTQFEAIERLKNIVGDKNIKVEYLNFEQSFFDFLETNLLSLKSFYRLFFNDVKITNFVFDEFFLLDKKIIDLRLDCLNCFVK
jgi:hypothetical protein